MTLLDEKIAALSVKAHQFSPAQNRPLPWTARLPKKHASETVVSEPRSKRQMRRGLTTGLRWLLKGWQSKQAHYGRDWI